MRNGKYFRKKELAGENFRYHRDHQLANPLPSQPVRFGESNHARSADYNGSRGGISSAIRNHYVAMAVVFHDIWGDRRSVA